MVLLWPKASWAGLPVGLRPRILAFKGIHFYRWRLLSFLTSGRSECQAKHWEDSKPENGGPGREMGSELSNIPVRGSCAWTRTCRLRPHPWPSPPKTAPAILEELLWFPQQWSLEPGGRPWRSSGIPSSWTRTKPGLSPEEFRSLEDFPQFFPEPPGTPDLCRHYRLCVKTLFPNLFIGLTPTSLWISAERSLP